MRALLSSPSLIGETVRGSAAEIGTAFVLKSRSSLTKMRENETFTRGGIRKAGVAGCVAKAECYPSAPVTSKTAMPHRQRKEGGVGAWCPAERCWTSRERGKHCKAEGIRERREAQG